VVVEHLGTWSDTQWVEAIRRLAAAGGLAWLDGDGTTELGAQSYAGAAPVETRVRRWADPDPLGALEEIEMRGEVPRWIGYIAYDAAWSGRAERARWPRPDDEPVLRFARYDALLVRRGDRVRIVADDRQALARMRAHLDRAPISTKARAGLAQATRRDAHADAIARIRRHIEAGDIYQANLARHWVAAYDGAPLALFLAMRRASPVPLGVFIDAGDHAVCARTMERFLRWEPDDDGQGRLETRPIKGTLGRRSDDDADAARLRSDEKERAEHTMIVDLMRNDLGKVAEVGTVEVVRALHVEPYARLHHLVSTVACRTRRGINLRDVLEATFPPGSVTGAPKVRAVELIEALEPGPRGIYCGCVGHIGRVVDLAVAIRTAVVRQGQVRYFAGGGLVWASDPEREVAETELKARVFLDALAAVRGG